MKSPEVEVGISRWWNGQSAKNYCDQLGRRRHRISTSLAACLSMDDERLGLGRGEFGTYIAIAFVAMINEQACSRASKASIGVTAAGT